MIPVYGSLITILLCTFFPPLFDHLIGSKVGWSWKKSLAGYAVMTGLVLVLPVLIGVSIYVDWLFAIIAVAIAVFIAPVTYLGTSFVLLLSNLILPTLILWDISRYNKVKEPMRMILENADWPKFITPMALGLLTLAVSRRLRQRLKTE